MLLREAERLGRVQHASFADLEGWSLTENRKAENERQLAVERESADPGRQIWATYRDFLSLNARLLRAVTDWQLSPTDADRFAANDHSDGARDARIMADLTELSAALVPLVERLTDVLARFGGYDERFAAALSMAKDGHIGWIDRTDVDPATASGSSCMRTSSPP